MLDGQLNDDCTILFREQFSLLTILFEFTWQRRGVTRRNNDCPSFGASLRIVNHRRDTHIGASEHNLMRTGLDILLFTLSCKVLRMSPQDGKLPTAVDKLTPEE